MLFRVHSQQLPSRAPASKETQIEICSLNLRQASHWTRFCTAALFAESASRSGTQHLLFLFSRFSNPSSFLFSHVSSSFSLLFSRISRCLPLSFSRISGRLLLSFTHVPRRPHLISSGVSFSFRFILCAACFTKPFHEYTAGAHLPGPAC